MRQERYVSEREWRSHSDEMKMMAAEEVIAADAVE